MTREENESLPGMDVDELLQTLRNPIRREIIRYFESRPAKSTASVDELVAHLESRESTGTSEVLWKTLNQVHLPTLQSRGWLVFDTEQNNVSYHGHEEAEQLIGEVHAIFKE